MTIRIEELTERLLVWLEESGEFLDSHLTADTSGRVDLRQLIAARLPDEARTLMCGLSGAAAGEWKSLLGEPVTAADYVARYELPPDYLSFVSLQMPDWNRAVTATVESDSLWYGLNMGRLDRLPALRARRPHVVEGYGPDGRELLIYGTTATHLATLCYLPDPVLGAPEGELWIPRRHVETLLNRTYTKLKENYEL